MTDNMGLARKMLAALGEGRIDGVLADMADDFEYRAMSVDIQIYPKDVLAKTLSDFSVMMDKWVVFTILGTTAEGDRIALECEGDGRTATGKSYRNRYLFLFEFRDGKVTSIREYMDTAYAAATFGG
jgi:ketosteroid isomerase-like protein